MSTELTIYDRFPDGMAAVKQLGHAIAASKMFGAETPAQGEVFALECLARRIPPLMLAENYHVIFGKLSMKAEAMLARFEELGGKYRVIERSADRAAIELTRDGQKQTFSLTWPEAQQEPFVYEAGKDDKGKTRTEATVIAMIAEGTPPPLKPKYATPRARTQMLWARVVSDGVRTMNPGVVSGTYTPEEVLDFNENAGKPAPASTNGHTDEIVDAEIVEAPEAGKPAAEEAPFDVPAEPAKPIAQVDSTNGATSGMCTADQSNKVKELFGLLEVSPEKRTEILAKRKAATVCNLTADQADELIAALQKKLDVRNAGGQLAATQAESSKPGMTDAEIVERIKTLAKQVEQTHPGTTKAIREKVTASGAEKLADLRREDLLSLLSALKDPDKMAAYFGVVIWEAAPKN